LTKTRTIILIAILILGSFLSTAFLVPRVPEPEDAYIEKRYKIHVDQDPSVNYTAISNSNVSFTIC